MIGKDLLPKSLFGRALLILLLPTLLIQVVMTYAFFDRHWGNISRYMARSLSGEIGLLVDQLKTLPASQHEDMINSFIGNTGIEVYFDPPASFSAGEETRDFPEFQEHLRFLLTEPFTVRKRAAESLIEVRILLPGEVVLRLQTTVKRLESRTTAILVWWMLGTTAVFLLIAVMFLRNQIRPIRRLAKAAEGFGRGVDMPDFKPSGATEVRMAARAFITMRERIQRQIRTRTDMLAGISHDLRTPLTRMKLQLAMLKSDEAAHELALDVEQMEHMIEEYLDFARGDVREDASLVSLKVLLENVVDDYRRQKADVAIEAIENVMGEVRVISFRRMLNNLIDNAIRYGKRCRVSLKPLPNAFEILVDDEGPGIPEGKREEVFQAFRRLEASRNIKTGGAGLGLTIARDIVLAHGGAISLATSPKGGLRVIVRIPLRKDPA